MNHFLFLVEKDDHLMGYDIYDTKKKIRNFTIDSGVYLAFSDDSLYNKKKRGWSNKFSIQKQSFIS